jgi:hypothetical protein
MMLAEHRADGKQRGLYEAGFAENWGCPLYRHFLLAFLSYTTPHFIVVI